jgi:transcriptional regulator of acetoin/glycerol metabolism
MRRSQLDAEIGEQPEDAPAWQERVLHKLGTRLRALSSHRKLDVRAFWAEDRELVEHSVLFELFHRFAGELDRLIEQKDKSREGPLRVDFAAGFLQELVACGITPERAERLFELFYQMRRAFFFISSGLTGKSPSVRALRENLWTAVFTCDLRRYERYLWNRMEDFSIIIVGETGTGKGAAAAAIGLSGFIPFDAKKQSFAYGFRESFVPIHLNEFPETLFESEIFGHRKGAFTGAVDNYEGALARCRPYGTVFFDEIGEATLPIQVKLLRVLQERLYTPVGTREPQRFHGRILAATHQPLAKLRAERAMRDDFFYRLCSNVIEVPPLRVRLAEAEDELAELCGHLCTRITGSPNAELAAELTAVIERELGHGYPFPGNVRELEQCVRRVLMTGHCQPDTLSASSAETALSREVEAGRISADVLVQRYCALLYARTHSYVEVARISGLDRRTVKKHVDLQGRARA